ncbi:insulinase family protein [Azotobacter sp. CWF10]
MRELPPLEQRSLRLDNGVQATLLHDPQARRVALAAGVDAGSLHEPEAWPGLAHFLEHCLFLGSEGFAEVGAFAGYVHGEGGRYNARTLGLHTQYYLEMPARELIPALERLCDLLARPLLLPERLLAEREVLHAEYLARCQDGDSQLLDALAALLEPGHPLARFHAGARDTLDPPSAAFLADLRAWHARHYRGENLRLLVCGPQSLGELEAQVRAIAGALPGGARVPAPAWPSPWPAGQGCLRLELEQPSRRRMSLWWALEHVAVRDEPALDLLRQALQRCDAGSLLGMLRARGLARSARLELHPADAGQALLALHLELLEEGSGREEQIAALCRDWLAWLQAAPERIGAPLLIENLRISQAWDEYEQAPLERAARWLECWQRQGGAELALWPEPPTHALLGEWLRPLVQPPWLLHRSRDALPGASLPHAFRCAIGCCRRLGCRLCGVLGRRPRPILSRHRRSSPVRKTGLSSGAALARSCCAPARPGCCSPGRRQRREWRRGWRPNWRSWRWPSAGTRWPVKRGRSASTARYRAMPDA